MKGSLDSLWRTFWAIGAMCPALACSQTLFRDMIGGTGSDEKSGKHMATMSLGYDYDWISKSSRNGLLESRVFGGRAWLKFSRREANLEFQLSRSNEFLDALWQGQSQEQANYRNVRTRVGAKWFGSGVSASIALEEGSQRFSGSWSDIGKVFDQLSVPAQFEWSNRPLRISGTVDQKLGSYRVGASFSKNIKQNAPLEISRDPDPLQVPFVFPFMVQTDDAGLFLQREYESSKWTASGAAGVNVGKGLISRASRGVIGSGESETKSWNVSFEYEQRFRSGQEATYWIAGAGYRSELSGRIRDGGVAGISAGDGYRVRYATSFVAERWDVGCSYSVKVGAEGQVVLSCEISHLPARFESEVSLSRFLNSVGTRYIDEFESLRVFQIGASYTRTIVDGVTFGVAVKQVIPATMRGGSGTRVGGRRSEGGTLISIEVSLGV